jgi:hypothetical protein
MREYEQVRVLDAVATVVAGGYNLPALIGKEQGTQLNDFDVIRFNGKYYVTGKTVVLDGTVELHNVPKWRVIGHVRYGKPTTRYEEELDWVLDSVCYFRLITAHK